MKKTAAVVAALLAAALTSTPVLADTDNYWSQVAASCAVGDPAIQGDLYLITSGSVKHDTNDTGTVSLYCAVSRNSAGTDPNALFLTHGDNSSDAGDYVTATLYKKARSTGTITSITSVTSANSTAESNQPVSHTFDWEDNAYYVRVDVVRNDTSSAITFYQVALGTAVI